MKYNNFIWDFDGTICDTYPTTINSIIKTMNNHNIDLDYDYLYKKAKITLSDVFEYIKSEYKINNDIIKEITNNFKYLKPSERNLYNGIDSILRYIKVNKGNNFLITHRDRKSTIEILNHYELKKFFKKIITSDDNFKSKPDPESFNYIINNYNLDRNKTVGIGDRKIDIGASINSNIYSIFMNFDNINDSFNANHVFTNYNDFFNNILVG